ncbi:MAG: DUF1735 domain-containing protein [Prolixibacteraceae bacterium]|nr:DUF1735 domain-containing protein [Prolixibacteraceae bacterium]
MKKIFWILIIAVVATSCYDDFRIDHTFSSIAFSRADGGSNVEGVLHRTVVKDEGLQLDMGLNLTGILENEEEHWVGFEIDPSLLEETGIKTLGYKLMPSDYYSFSNGSKFIIEAGSILGKVTVIIDSAKFLNDPLSLKHRYAIPFRLTDTSADSINSELDTKILVVKYINHFEGYYDQTGTVTSFDAGGSQTGTTSLENVITLTTTSLDTVVSDGMMNQIGSDFAMKIVVNSDNSVNIGNTAGSQSNMVTENGDCKFNGETSTFTLNYKVTSTDGTYKNVSSQMVWRNRIRDGVNEWRR